MPLAAGSRLGAYEIVAPIGAGGMGEVYRARDSRLNRDVAIKVLPEGLSHDAAALVRFEREAQAVASLSHPNILAIHDFGTERGITYAVTELLEGETLRARLLAGAFTVRKAVEYGVQVVRGIAAAHERGIVHRDLKPENIFITRDGVVKILDFGLAKAAEPPLPADVTQLGGTSPGTVLGTVGYMSPEQVRGEPVDHRTDIFSFGAMLYEMLTGRRAFSAGSQVETMNAILKEDPPEFVDVNPNLPVSLERIIRRCLEKQPAERFYSAHDLAIALEAFSGASTHSMPAIAAGPVAGRRRWLGVLVAGAVVVLVGVAAFLAGRALAGAASAQPTYHRLTFRRGPVFSARMAADGDTVIYSAAWDGAQRQLYSTRAGSPESLQLSYADAEVVSISSAGELAIVSNRRIINGYSRPGTLARAPMSGGAPRDVLEDVQDADWLPDASSLVVSHVVGNQYRLEFPIGKVVYETGGWISHPRVSADGRYVAFLEHPILGDDRGFAAVADAAGQVRRLSEQYESVQGLAWKPGTEEIWYTGAARGSARVLHAVTLDGRVPRVILRVPANLLLGDIAADGTVLVEHDNGRRGIVGLAPGATKEQDLSWFDWSQPQALSADGRTLLITEEGDGGGIGYSVYLRKTDGSPAVRLGGGDAQALSSDGKWVLAQRLNPEPAQLVLLPTGAGESRMVTSDNITHLSAAFAPDGKRFLFTGFERKKRSRTWIQSLSGGAPKAVTPEGVTSLLISPDGTKIAARDEDGQRKFFPVDGGTPEPISFVEQADGVIRFTADGRGLFVRRPAEDGAVQISRLDLTTGARTPVRLIAPLREAVGTGGIGPLLLTPDASAYVYGYGVRLSDLYLVKGLK